jgi:hypothetical protein
MRRQVARRPLRLHGGRADGDATFALDRREIGGRVAVVHFADAVDLAAFPQQAFGQRGLAGVDVGNDAKVATAGKDLGVHKEVPAKPTSGAAHPGWRQGARLAFGLGDLVHGTFSLRYWVG